MKANFDNSWAPYPGFEPRTFSTADWHSTTRLPTYLIYLSIYLSSYHLMWTWIPLSFQIKFELFHNYVNICWIYINILYNLIQRHKQSIVSSTKVFLSLALNKRGKVAKYQSRVFIDVKEVSLRIFINSKQTCHSVTFYFMKNSFFDVSRKCIFTKYGKTHFLLISENEFLIK